jgi:ATP adenylyltransferase
MPIGLLSHAEICAKFDRLVSDGIIAYQPSKPVLVVDKGMIVSLDHMTPTPFQD